jgi:hypothetical protein
MKMFLVERRLIFYNIIEQQDGYNHLDSKPQTLTAKRIDLLMGRMGLLQNLPLKTF